MLPYNNLKLASDIEAKGFYDVVNTVGDIHCLCSIDIDTDEVYLFHDHPEFDGAIVADPYDGKKYTIPTRKGGLAEGIAWWSKVANNGGTLIVHNAHTYDRPVCNKIWPDNNIPFDAWHDTLIQSKVQWYERPTPKGVKGAHGLAAYGKRCGVNKPDVDDWSFIDAFKLHRCIEDCHIQKRTYVMLQQEAVQLKTSYGIDFTQALKIESLYADCCFQQEVVGVKLDIEHINRCLIDLDTKISALTVEIEPQLPPTLKPKGVKVSRSEVATLLGFDGSKVKDVEVQVRRKGEIITTVEKPYVKPSTNYTNKANVTEYEGFNVSYGGSPRFTKKKDLTAWIKEHHPETKPKDWNIEKIVTEGFVLDNHCCNHFGLEPEDTDIVVGPYTRLTIEPSTLGQSELVKTFLIKLGWKDAEEWNLKKDFHDNNIKVEEDTVVVWPPNAHPDYQLRKLIKKGGYLVSSPKLSEEDYEQLPEGLGRKIAEYNTYVHRRNFLENSKDPDNKGLLSYVRDDGRIPAGVNNFATRSGRGAQRIWVNAPSVGSLYGEEIRECIIAEDGKVLVGADMKSAQLSIAAYYANNYDYYNNVATGIEFDEEGKYVGKTAHCVNARMFGMVTVEEWLEAIKNQCSDLIHRITIQRKKSKGGSFAVIFGASGSKVAKTIGIPECEGNSRKKQFLEQMGLDGTISELAKYEGVYKHKGGFYLPLAFGYWLWNNSSHKSVNTIVQGYEALAQKLAVIRLHRELERSGLAPFVNKVLDVHDEFLLEVVKGYEDKAGKLAGECYTWAADQIYKYHVHRPDHFANPNPPTFPIDLNGGYKVGINYCTVH